MNLLIIGTVTEETMLGFHSSTAMPVFYDVGTFFRILKFIIFIFSYYGTYFSIYFHYIFLKVRKNYINSISST